MCVCVCVPRSSRRTALIGIKKSNFGNSGPRRIRVGFARALGRNRQNGFGAGIPWTNKAPVDGSTRLLYDFSFCLYTSTPVRKFGVTTVATFWMLPLSPLLSRQTCFFSVRCFFCVDFFSRFSGQNFLSGCFWIIQFRTVVSSAFIDTVCRPYVSVRPKE